VDVRFDEPNVVSWAGLVPVMRLAAAVGLGRLVGVRVRVGGSVGSNPGGKVCAVVAGMVAGADSIDDLGVLRAGGMGRLFGRCYAPSTLGSFLRGLRWGHVRALESAARAFLVGLAGAAPLLPGADRIAFVDVDSLLRRVYGHAKQGAAHGHTPFFRNPVSSTISTPPGSPRCSTT
jgi:hypothetical protein